MTEPKKRSRKKVGEAPPPDRHVGRILVGIESEVHAALKTLAERNDRPLTRELRRIVIAALTAEGLWPPPDASAR